jgi:hypothetical protein
MVELRFGNEMGLVCGEPRLHLVDLLLAIPPGDYLPRAQIPLFLQAFFLSSLIVFEFFFEWVQMSTYLSFLSLGLQPHSIFQFYPVRSFQYFPSSQFLLMSPDFGNVF